MKLKHVVFGRYIPLGGGKAEFHEKQGYQLEWQRDVHAILIIAPNGEHVWADTIGASWKPADEEYVNAGVPAPKETDGGDQPSPAASPARGKKQKRTG